MALGDRRKIELEVVVNSDTDGSKKAAASLEKVDVAAGKAGDSLNDMAKDADKANVSVGKTGDSVADVTTDLEKFEDQIGRTKSRIRELEEALSRTGSRAGASGLRRELAQERSWLRELERAAKELAPQVPRSILQNLDFSEMVAESRGMLIAGGVALAGAMAPVVAGVLSSAIVGAVGAGGVVGGAVLAAQSPHVKAAWADLGHGLMDELKPVSAAFQQPAIDAAKALGEAFRQGGYVQALEHAADLMPSITEAIAGFGKNLGPGIDAAFGGAEPTWKMLATELPQFGSSLTRFFQSLEDSGPAAAIAMQDFFNVLEDGTEEIGPAIEGLTDLYVVTRGLNNSVKELTGKSIFGDIIPTFGLLSVIGKMFGDTGAEIEGIKPSVEELTSRMVGLGDATGGAAKEFRSLDDALSISYTSMQNWTKAEIDVESAFDRLADSLEEGGQNWDLDTEAGRRNMQNLIDIAGAADAAIQKKFAESQSVADTTRTYEAYRQKLYDMLIDMGMNAEAAQAMIDKWLGLAKLQDIQKYLHINVVTQGRGGIGTSQAYLESDNPFLKGYAAGGQTPGGYEPFVVGEDGPEVMWDSRAHYVETMAMRRAAMSGASGSQSWLGSASSMGVAPLHITVMGSHDDAILIERIREAVSARGASLAVLGLKA
jgi:hypothetical protein